VIANLPFVLDILLVYLIFAIVSVIVAVFATIFSGIGKRTVMLQCGFLAYTNDGVKKKLRLNFNFTALLMQHVVIHSFNVYDNASFHSERKYLVRFHVLLLILYPTIAVAAAGLYMIFHTGYLGLILIATALISSIHSALYSRLGGKLDTNAKAYIMAKFDNLYMLLNVNDGLTYATKYPYDPEPVRAYQIAGICTELADPAVNPDVRLSTMSVTYVFSEYIRKGRTDFPKIIRDYFEYYLQNGSKFFEGKGCTQNCTLWQSLLLYLAVTGRRDEAIAEYNRRATYMIMPGKASQFINGSLRYLLFNEDYSLWLLERKNMHPTAIDFIDKWFEMPYFQSAEFIINLHKMLWENDSLVIKNT
jgi:hypothetical protein